MTITDFLHHTDVSLTKARELTARLRIAWNWGDDRQADHHTRCSKNVQT